MNFSRECEYAVRGMVALAGEPRGQALTLQEVAAGHNLPPGFLSKIFQKLVRHGLIQSHRGVQRGYTLAHPAPEITLRQILEAIEGPDLFDRCVFSHRRCGEGGQCLVHPYWRRVRGEVTTLFEEVSLRDLLASAGQQAAGSGAPEDPPEEPAWIRDKVRALYS
ncbi:MAG TPA: Rrf2 family transcriptional regulator [Candidatus Sulfotelmatobacter sp.]|nr:Rrf2 family transcriptional regulator [Candidatus Sulfotelmatobacter sp.]